MPFEIVGGEGVEESCQCHCGAATVVWIDVKNPAIGCDIIDGTHRRTKWQNRFSRGDVVAELGGKETPTARFASTTRRNDWVVVPVRDVDGLAHAIAEVLNADVRRTEIGANARHPLITGGGT